MSATLVRTTILASVLALAATLTSNQGTQAAPQGDQQWQGTLVEVIEGKIIAVDRNLVVQEFLVHPGARITLNYRAVKLFALRPGDAVTVNARPASEAMGIAAFRAPQ